MRQKIFSAREEQLIKANKSLYILRTLPKEGFNQSEIDPLFNTIVLPSAAGLVSGIRRSDHITPDMKDLHWLPIGVRMNRFYNIAFNI